LEEAQDHALVQLEQKLEDRFRSGCLVESEARIGECMQEIEDELCMLRDSTRSLSTEVFDRVISHVDSTIEDRLVACSRRFSLEHVVLPSSVLARTVDCSRLNDVWTCVCSNINHPDMGSFSTTRCSKCQSFRPLSSLPTRGRSTEREFKDAQMNPVARSRSVSSSSQLGGVVRQAQVLAHFRDHSRGRCD